MRCIIFLLCFFSVARLLGEEKRGYTNHAGFVLQAEPEVITADQRVRFRKPDGKILWLPLLAFPEAEQKRIHEALEPCSIPEGLQIAWQQHLSALKKVDLLHERGILSDAERAEARAHYLELWKQRLAHYNQKSASDKTDIDPKK